MELRIRKRTEFILKRKLFNRQNKIIVDLVLKKDKNDLLTVLLKIASIAHRKRIKKTKYLHSLKPLKRLSNFHNLTNKVVCRTTFKI